MEPRCRAARCAAGFTLVETVVAAGILAGVLLATAGLLLSGARLAAEARHASAALTVATSLVERLHGLGLEQTVRAFDAGDCRPESDRECSFDPTRAAGGVEWGAELDRALDEGQAGIRLQAIDASALDRALALRAEVRVSWREGSRRRAIVVVALRSS